MVACLRHVKIFYIKKIPPQISSYKFFCFHQKNEIFQEKLP